MQRFIAYTKSMVGVMMHARNATRLPSLSELVVHKEALVTIKNRHTSVMDMAPFTMSYQGNTNAVTTVICVYYITMINDV